METNSVSKLLLLVFTVLFVGSELIHCSVTYDRKAIIINGQRRILISGSIHYPRSTPEVCILLITFFVLFCLKFVDCCVFYLFVWNVCVVVDVGGSNWEGERRRPWCHWHLCFLECSWAISWQCTTLESGSSFHWIQFQNSQVPSHTVFFWFVCYFCGVGLQYNFEGRYDLVRFIKTVQRVGLYVHLRIGPYVCAEWNFGYSMHFQLSLVDFFGFLVSMLNHIVWWCNCRGFPVWLKYVPGISFRTDNGPFKVEP